MLIYYLAMVETEAEKTKFTFLYEEYKNLMFHVAYEILKDENYAEDSVHKAFLSILAHMDDVGDVKSKKTLNWVLLITKNQAIDDYRIRKRTFKRVIEFETLDRVESSESVEHVTDAVDLKNIIASMPELYRDILQLVVYYAQDYKTIAKTLHITQATARKRFQRAKEMLKEILRERGDFIDDL